VYNEGVEVFEIDSLYYLSIDTCRGYHGNSTQYANGESKEYRLICSMNDHDANYSRASYFIRINY